MNDPNQPMMAARSDEQRPAMLPARTRAPMSALAQAGQQSLRQQSVCRRLGSAAEADIHKFTRTGDIQGLKESPKSG